MEWPVLFDLIDTRLIVVVAACWAIGYSLKQTPKVPDWSIIYLVTLFAIIMALLMIGMSAEAVLQGILCGTVAVYGHQALKQGKEGIDRE